MSWISGPPPTRIHVHDRGQRNRYSAEFETQAVELLVTGRPVGEIAGKLCISSNLLFSWKDTSQRAQVGSEVSRSVDERDGADDLRTLRREVARLLQENDILKKAAVILGTKPQPNSAP